MGASSSAARRGDIGEILARVLPSGKVQRNLAPAERIETMPLVNTPERPSSLLRTSQPT